MKVRMYNVGFETASCLDRKKSLLVDFRNKQQDRRAPQKRNI